jgi:hypothetical protein
VFAICSICSAARRDCSSRIYSKMAPLPYETCRRCKVRRAVIKMAAPAEANGHEHIARAMYYFSVYLLFASIVGSVAWVLT